jgi:hypothetical protein
MLTPFLKENPSNAVFLLRDPDTQRVCRLCDFTKAPLIRPVVAHAVAGKVVNRGKRHLVIATVCPDTRNAWFSTVPVPVDGVGGSAIG